MESGKKFMLLVLFAAVAGFTSCSDDDDSPIDPPPVNQEPVSWGSFNLSEVPLHGEMVLVENLNMPKDGWIVVRRDNGNNGPMMTEIISIPELLAKGNHSEYMIQLEENLQLVKGERLWVNLHADDGDKEFSYDGNEGDIPLGIYDVFAGYQLISDSFMVNLQNP